MTSDDATITPQDIADLNRVAIERVAWVCRVAGTFLVVVGVVGAVGWLWTAVRYQQQLGPFTFGIPGGPESSSVGALDRIDLFMSSLGLLMTGALVAGLGVGMRLAADYTKTRVGASVADLQVGDRLDDG